ncbi:DoxX family protein [Actibacterium lipolyticum]|uniref:DoxX n=1 Tax=Actibacterium lipolyticum TaxID=1524263 RepID=A0A238JR62_9RHOB|nr:DoxX family protein [Actibacterium lipolyticum]SMX32953.1 DoxX [Actibacterium lipolyticum]
MNALINTHNAVFDWIEHKTADWLLPTLARFAFAATLLFYFWNSGMTKLGDGISGIFTPSLGAYGQIFPKALEAVGYDISKLGLFHRLVVMAGTYAEFVLPLLLVVGFATRLAALGMIGFITVQTLTDLFGHGAIAHAETVGAWFDRFPDSLILDQRLFWLTVLVTLVLRGGGPLSLDRLLSKA